MNSETPVTSYMMNPAEDEIRFGGEIAEGMWVLPESRDLRSYPSDPEDMKLRDERFRRVTRLTRQPDTGCQGGVRLTFIGEWVDGYQEVWIGSNGNAWLVKKSVQDEQESK
jgi:hypothetical protein